MEDFQGKYNGKQIEQLLDKANDIDLTKYALKTDNAPTATKLQAARTIVLSGAVSGSVSSDFGSNVTISTTLSNFDASKITSGTIDIDRLPKAALERMVVVADDTARFKLTTATAQVGDTVKVTATNKMYLVKDDSKLNTEDGYEPLCNRFENMEPDHKGEWGDKDDMDKEASFVNLVRDRDDDDKFAILWNFSSDDDIMMRNICHESFHIAMSVCQFCNMSLGFKVGEDEHAAYIAGFAGDCVSEFINSKNTD